MTSLKDAIGTIIGRNTRIALWVTNKNDSRFSDMIWKGMAWAIPDKYLNIGKWMIFGTVVEDIMDSDVVNILIEEEK